MDIKNLERANNLAAHLEQARKFMANIQAKLEEGKGQLCKLYLVDYDSEPTEKDLIFADVRSDDIENIMRSSYDCALQTTVDIKKEIEGL